ncbi:MAG: leucine-rich repeat protein, partial [Candidatus Methanomethylophilus sp.]|nr:leucine-rich repeat protein [Methanomethylophilus sp.]
TSLASVTIPDSITSIGDYAFDSCDNLSEVNVACPNPLNITAGDTSNGYVAYYASNVNFYHTYSATYTWADDGSACTVDIACSHGDTENHQEHPEVAHTVKIPPTETEMGTTAYSVSGTYDGFAYSDTKDVQDIPPDRKARRQ